MGESASNGLAERAVQAFEDQLRTFLSELEARIGSQIAAMHAVVSWLVEYTTVVLNKYHVHDDTGETAYKALHGKDASEKLAYVGDTFSFTFQLAVARTLISAGPQASPSAPE